MVAALGGGRLDTGITLEKLVPFECTSKKCSRRYSKLIMGLQGVDVNVLLYQIPGACIPIL
jgi:oxaloacetate decarboxylase alpha subunit